MDTESLEVGVDAARDLIEAIGGLVVDIGFAFVLLSLAVLILIFAYQIYLDVYKSRNH